MVVEALPWRLEPVLRLSELVPLWEIVRLKPVIVLLKLAIARLRRVEAETVPWPRIVGIAKPRESRIVEICART